MIDPIAPAERPGASDDPQASLTMTTEQPQNVSHPQREPRPLVLIATRRNTGRDERLSDQMVQTLLDEADQRGWRLLDLNMTEGSLSGEQAPAGALVTLLPTDEMAQKLMALGCPIVRLARHKHPDDESMPAVLPDYEAAGRMAADYFAERGFRDLALVGHAQMASRHLIEYGLRTRGTELGCAFHEMYFDNLDIANVPGNRPEDRYEMRTRKLGHWLNQLPKPLGLLACVDGIAGWVSIMCQRTGIAVPEDVAVLSIGNSTSECRLGPVPLSAIEFSQRDTGKAAVKLLADLINRKSAPAQTFVSPRAVITRRSTDILAVDDPTVARAIRYIWDHLDLRLNVSDVAKAVSTPRYKLERLFRKYLERGVGEELRRARLERFRHLLRTTDQTVDQLAPQVGYRSSKRLHSVFKNAFGQTPRRYRLEAQGADDNGQ
jgi:LacI family transcriptional regulator